MMKWVFGADTTPFRKGLDDMRTQTKAFSGSVTKMLAGAFSIGLVVNGFKSLVAQLTRIDDLAQRFGESAETMQRVGHAAVMAGTDLESVARAMTVVTKNSYAAATGNKAMAEAFAAFGIDAASFVNLPMEEKMLMLAKAMEASKGNGAKLAEVMKILGKSGGDMIPLLAQGFEELKAQMEGTGVVSQSTVDSMAKLDDAFETLKQKATVVGAAVYDGLRLIGGTIGAVVYGAVQNAIISLQTLVGSALDAGAIVGNVLTGDFDAAGKATERFKSRIKDAFGEAGANAKAVGGTIAEIFDDVYSEKTPEKKDSANDVDSVIAAAEEAAKSEEERKKLAEEIAKLQEEARMKDLSLAQQILEIEKKRAEAMAEAVFGDDETARLEGRKKELEMEKELAALKEKQQAESEKSAKEISDATAESSKRIAEATTREAEAQRNRKFNNADTEGKVGILTAEQKELMRQSQEAGKAGDYETQIDRRTEAAAKSDEIDSLLKSELESLSGPTISAGSLASIGAGGSANLLTSDTTEQRKISLLEMIAANTAKGETGTTNIPEPV